MAPVGAADMPRARTEEEKLAFLLYLWKREERRGGEEEKGEKRREKEKGKRKDYEVMGRAPAAF